MKKRIQIIFLLLIIAIISLMYVGASSLEIQTDNSNEIKAIGNTEIDKVKLDDIISYAQVNVGDDELNKIEFHFLDVGQGDSTLVILPNGKTLLIDAGGSNYGNKVVNYIKSLKISKIDYLVMTHPHADHIGGMEKVIDNFDIGTIYMTDMITTTKTFNDLLLNIERKNLKIITPKANDIISAGDDFKVLVLSPSRKYEGINEMSLVIQMIYKNNSFLLMGDSGTIVENDILNSNLDIKSDLIKIGHHGSSYSSSSRFIQSISPQFAIISFGKNPYGHPSSKTLETLNKYRVKIYSTYEFGDIIVSSDGNSIKIDYNS